jgi:hypothetical protein
VNGQLKRGNINKMRINLHHHRLIAKYSECESEKRTVSEGEKEREQ